jgi:NADPH:quinone reductase
VRETMRAAFYERQGAADEVLELCEVAMPEPGPGEVRVRLSHSGVNFGDVKKRKGWPGSPMAFARVIPHSDGAGRISAVGPDVYPSRVGERVWVYGAQSYRPFGTAAEATVVPERQAVTLPDGIQGAVGACLGIAGITAHRAVFADGPIDERIVLVHGVGGAVGSLAVQLAHRAGARVIGTVRHTDDLAMVDARGATEIVSLDVPHPAREIRRIARDGVDRVIDVALAANAELDAQVIAQGGVIAAYASPADPVPIPFWPLLFRNATIRLLGSDDFPADAKHRAAIELTMAAADGLSIPINATLPLSRIAVAHDLVEAGSRSGRVVLTVS